MRISIIIVNYKVKYLLEQCLLSVRKAIAHLDSEVIVVDNHSQDGSIDYLEDRFPDVLFIENKENVGFSKANNQAIKIAKGEYVLLLNPDTLLAEDTLETVIQFMDKTPDAGGVGVKMIDSTGRFLPESKRSLPTPWVSFCKIFGLSQLFPKSQLFNQYALGALDADKVHEIDIMAGAFMMMRKEALEKVGYLDERFFMYGEDIDLSFRIQQGGYKNYYLPSKILHYKGESTPKDSKYVKVFYHAMDLFYKKHYPSTSPLFSIPIRLAIYLRAAMAIGIQCVKKGKRVNNLKKERILTLATPASFNQIQALVDDADLIASYTDKNIATLSQMIEANRVDKVILSDSVFSFSDMIHTMDSLRDAQVGFAIHSYQSNTVVASNKFYHKKQMLC